MTTSAGTRAVRALAAATLAGTALIAPAVATPALAEEVGSTCEVTGGELTWGVKEGFRSYISGTIANGEWQVSDGASYETPSFTFSGANGRIDATTGEGSISFAGTVLFTGHEGVLNLTIANPTIEFVGDGTARLLLDTRSNNAEGELVIDETQVSFGKIDSVGDLDPAAGELTLSEAPVVLTADGAAAFSGFYSSGEALDPISLSAQLTPCASASDAPTASDEPEATTQPVDDETETAFPWLPVILGALALVVIGVAAGMLIAGRRKGAGADSVSENGSSEISGSSDSEPPLGPDGPEAR